MSIIDSASKVEISPEGKVEDVKPWELPFWNQADQRREPPKDYHENNFSKESETEATVVDIEVDDETLKPKEKVVEEDVSPQAEEHELPTVDEVERIREQAQQEGFNAGKDQGYQEGLELGKKGAQADVLVMTATPLSMVEMNGLSLQHATFVIQSHIVAMFLPSVVTGKLLKMGLHFSLIIAGLMCYLVVIIVAFSGHQVMHFWWALVLLGLGWNLLFMASTAMLPETYLPSERFKAQAFNEFSVFTAQAIAAFSAGWILFNYRWNGVLYTALGISVFWIIALIVLSWRGRRSVQTKPYVPNTD